MSPQGIIYLQKSRLCLLEIFRSEQSPVQKCPHDGHRYSVVALSLKLLVRHSLHTLILQTVRQYSRHGCSIFDPDPFGRMCHKWGKPDQQPSAIQTDDCATISSGTCRSRTAAPDDAPSGTAALRTACMYREAASPRRGSVLFPAQRYCSCGNTISRC